MDTLEFPPHNGKTPYSSLSENAMIAAKEQAYTLKNPASQAPFSNIEDK